MEHCLTRLNRCQCGCHFCHRCGEQFINNFDRCVCPSWKDRAQLHRISNFDTNRQRASWIIHRLIRRGVQDPNAYSRAQDCAREDADKQRYLKFDDIVEDECEHSKVFREYPLLQVMKMGECENCGDLRDDYLLSCRDCQTRFCQRCKDRI